MRILVNDFSLRPSPSRALSLFFRSIMALYSLQLDLLRVPKDFECKIKSLTSNCDVFCTNYSLSDSSLCRGQWKVTLLFASVKFFPVPFVEVVSRALCANFFHTAAPSPCGFARRVCCASASPYPYPCTVPVLHKRWRPYFLYHLYSVMNSMPYRYSTVPILFSVPLVLGNKKRPN